MKKMLVLVTVLALICSLGVPAMADGSADARLAEVTAKVKETLGLDTAEYTEFYGDLEDNPLSPVWDLEWSNDDGEQISVTATEDGKVLSFYLYDNTAYVPASGFAPAFPEGDRDSAGAAAMAFLGRVLTEGETALPDPDDSPLRLGATSYRFYGEILVNGLSTGLSYSVTVRCSDNQILRFYRDDLTGAIMGGIPSPTPAITSEKAASVLRDTLSLRLEYVAEGDGSRAVLRWLPDRINEYYVDAVTGELVNLTELFDEAASGGSGAPGSVNGDTGAADTNESASQGMTPAEQEGIAKLEGVLSREALDEAARSFTALGLDKYTLSAASYSVAREAEEGEEPLVTASLRYGRQVEDYTWRRVVTLNGRTGELISVYSSGGLPEGVEQPVSFENARTKAESFLKSLEPERFAKTDLYDSTEGFGRWSHAHSFTFAQKENGYFFPDNSLNIEIDATDGSVSGYSKYFTDGVTFDSAQGVCSEEEAVDAWLGTYEATLSYILVPAAVDFSKPEYAPLEGMGISYLYRMALGYSLVREREPLGIDAKTAQPVYPEIRNLNARITYSDMEGHWAKERVETLAAYQVGFTGGVFQPDKAITQIDLLTLLVGAAGYRYDPEAEGAADRLYETAYNLGILTRDERNDGATLTRAETLKLIMDASGYGPVAQLQGIYRTGFTDDASIPAEYYGYAALGQGLKIVSGQADGSFMANAPATRAEAAVMLYNLMDR